MAATAAADRVTLTVGDALAPCLEGMSLADEATSAFRRIVEAAKAGDRVAVQTLAASGQARVSEIRKEFARLAGEIDR